MTADNATRWSDYVTQWGLNAVLAATLVTAVALAVAACVRRRPALRYGLLGGCLAVLVTTPLLALLTPTTGYSLWSWDRTAQMSPAPVTKSINPPSDIAHVEQGTGLNTDTIVVSSNENSRAPRTTIPAGAIMATPANRSTKSDAAAAIGRPPRPGWQLPVLSPGERLSAAAREAAPWLVALWLAGALVGLVRLALAWRRLNSLVRDAAPVKGDAATVLAECLVQLGIEHVIGLVASDRIASPFATGLRTAHIVLPATWAARATSEQLRTVLLHEAAHVARQDPVIVLVQQLTAVFYWFHPLVGLFNVRLAEAREETCDNHVLATIDAPAYSRTLLTLAESIQPLRPQPTTAGLFASRWRLERRIAGLLDEHRDRTTSLTLRSKAAVGSLALVVAAGATLAAGTVVRGQPPVENAATPAPAADAADVLARAAAAAKGAIQSIETAYVRFRKTHMAGPFKPGITPERCSELLVKYDLAARPDSLRDLLVEILSANNVSATPWSEMELHTAHPGTATVMVRETRHSPNRDPDVHVVTPDVSLRWDERSSQLDITTARDNHVLYTRLGDFWSASSRDPADATSVSIGRDEISGRPALRLASDKRTAFIDSETGFYLRVNVNHNNQSHLHRWLGWRPIANGPAFPTAVIDLRFTHGQLSGISAYLVDEVQFNTPFSPASFVLGAPAGAVVVDRRGGQESVERINHDVFDVSSAELVNEAAQPLKPEPTPTELAAFADLRRMYVLPDGEALRRLGPPYPLSRKYLMLMLKPHYASERRGTPHAVIEWKDGQLSGLRTCYVGFAPTLGHLIETLLRQSPAHVDIPADVLRVELPGDYLVRSDATRDDLASTLSTIVSQALARPVRLQYQEVTRDVYVVRGTLTLDESNLPRYSDRPLIAVQGADDAGVHGEPHLFGDLGQLLNHLSDYIDAKIVDETTASDRQLVWSIPASQRLPLNPQTVLELVAQQTGVTFERQARTVNVLNLAKP